MRGLERTAAMLGDRWRTRCRGSGWTGRGARAALAGGALATDEVMRRVEDGDAVPQRLPRGGGALKAGRSLPAPTPAEITAAPALRPAASATLPGARSAAGARRWRWAPPARLALRAGVARLAGRGR